MLRLLYLITTPNTSSPGKSALQASVRRIRPDTLSQIHRLLMSDWLAQDKWSLDALRIDSTVVGSHIAGR